MPLSALSTGVAGAGSLGPVSEPGPAPVLLRLLASAPPAAKFAAGMLTWYWPGFSPVNR